MVEQMKRNKLSHPQLMILFATLFYLGVVLNSSSALAASYDLTPPNRPAICSGKMGTWSGTTYTCGWNNPFKLNVGDSIFSQQVITIVSNNGFDVTGASIGGQNHRINLKSLSGQVIKLTSTTLYGDVDGHTVVLEQANIQGNVLSNGGTITAKSSQVSGWVRATNGTVTLVESEVWGLVRSDTSKVTISGSSIIHSGAQAGTNGIEISDSEVTGDLIAGNNPIKLTNVIMHSGNISSGQNNVEIYGGEINANIPNAHRVFVYNGAVIRGDISARYEVNINQSTIYGTVQTTDDHDGLHHVKLTDSIVYGDVLVRDDWGTITGNWPNSAIYGECTYKTVTPNLCRGGLPDRLYYRFTYNPVSLACETISLLIEAIDLHNNFVPSQQVQLELSGVSVIGGNSLSFLGSTEVYLERVAGSYMIGIAGALPLVEGVQCSTANCALDIVEAGFLVDVPHLIAAEEGQGSLQAVRTDSNTQACVPYFANENKLIEFSYGYSNPNTGTLAPIIAGQSLLHSNLFVSLQFDASARATFPIQYDDAGELSLAAIYRGIGPEEAGLVMQGATRFVSKPHHLRTTYVAGESEGERGRSGFIAAGAEFDVLVTAFNKNNALTPNWGRESPHAETFQLTPVQLYPEAQHGGELGTLTRGVIAAPQEPAQRRLIGNRYSETGKIEIKAETANYLGAGAIPHWESDVFGRFYPDRFELVSSYVGNSCTSFSYMSEPNITYQYELQAVGVQGNQLYNYHDAVNFYTTAELAQIDSRLYTVQQGVIPENISYFLDTPSRWQANLNVLGRWQRGIYSLAQANAHFSRANPEQADGPYHFKVGLKVAAEQDERNFGTLNLANEAVELNGELYMRYGRLIMENVHGPESEPLLLQIKAEYWNGLSFVLNGDDSCTQLNENLVTVNRFEPFGSNQTVEIEAGGGQVHLDGWLWLEPPHLRGEGDVEYEAPDWLKFWWFDANNPTGAASNPKAEFSFGQYSGHPRIIYRREL